MRVSFDKGISKEAEKRIQDELRARAVIFDDEDPSLLRHKLNYLPMILRTTMYDIGIWTTSLEVAVKKVKKVGVADPTRNYEFYLLGFNSFKLGEEKARELCKRWIREDESRFDDLVAKLPVKLRLANTYGEGDVLYCFELLLLVHVYFYAKDLALKQGHLQVGVESSGAVAIL